ncbi:D-2-hydroxyacid dehydrogenase [Aliagarivorans marinus]|uniref:D-2-hydroxyacid dehydrogenase n=1 Tax=Aliagarivorans marinus TaxID=561965 RepID=UPI0004222169|nr:D-2-hydroxyacid dehydrogenase [Aliagarivorans marinus]
MKIVFLDRQTLAPHIQLRPLSGEHHWQNYNSTLPEQVLERLSDCDIAVVNKVQLTAALLKQLPKLKLIAVAATGTNNVDLAAAQALGIKVCNIRDYAAQTIAEHVMALIYALQRSIGPYHQSIANGRWQAAQQFCYFDYPIENIRGKTLALVGYGNLGQHVASLAKANGLHVIVSERPNEPAREGRVEFKQALREANIVSLHCPLTPQTQGMIGAAELQMMKPNSMLINTARGGIVDEQALLTALRNKQIAGAASDVFVNEPPKADDPVMQLVTLDNFIATPHVAWAATENMQALADQLLENVEAFIACGLNNEVLPG